MIAVVFLLLIVLSNVCFFSVVKQRRACEILPITCTGIVFILFVSGYFGLLKYGVYTIELLAVLLYCVTLHYLVKNRTSKKSQETIISQVIIFLICVLIICWAMYGKLFDSWDEFSHWGDCVKVMFFTDDYITGDPFSVFQAYPPGMALFQYFLEKISYQTGNAIFQEWLAYVAYQILLCAFILPQCNINRQKSFWTRLVICLLTVFAAPLLFGVTVYKSLYIDTFLGVLFACGMGALIRKQKSSVEYILYECSVCMMLVLAKDAGLLFASFLAIAVVLDLLLEKGENNTLIYKTYMTIVLLASVLIPKIMWSRHLARRNIVMTDTVPYDYRELIGIVKHNVSGTYRVDVYNNFITRLQTDKFALGNLSINNIVLVGIIFLATIGIQILLFRKGRLDKKRIIISTVEILVVAVIYVFGILLIYMYKFTEFEGVNLASYERYMCIIFEGIWMFGVFCGCYYLDTIENVSLGKTSQITALLSLLLFLFSKGYSSYFCRISVKASENFRDKYCEMLESISENCEPGSIIHIISQGDAGLDISVLKTAARPVNAANISWSIGEATSEIDTWTKNYNPNELQEAWKVNYCDYVALFQVNDQLWKYSGLFYNQNDIKECSVYKVDNNYCLTLVE